MVPQQHPTRVWRLILPSLIVFLMIACYPASALSRDLQTVIPEGKSARIEVQLVGFSEVSEAVAFRDLLQSSPLVSELKPERLSWAAGRPELGLARWTLYLKDDARGALQAELLTRGAADANKPLHLQLRKLSDNLIEFSLAEAVAVIDESGSDLDADVSAVDEPDGATDVETEDVVVAPLRRPESFIRGGRGFD